MADLKTQKSYQVNKQLLNTSGNNHHNKQKLARSGSLTSTPSKFKSSNKCKSNNPKNNETSQKCHDMTNTTTNTNSTISSTASNNTNYLFSSDSFISSIPERQNDSTLVGNHHYSNPTHKLKRNNQNNNNQGLSNKSANTNTQTQTTPHATLKKSESFNTSTIVQCTTSTIVQEKQQLTESVNQAEDSSSQKNNMRASYSSSDLSSQLNNINTITANMLVNSQNQLSGNRSSMLNNSNSSTASNQLHPVMFLSLQQITSLVNELQVYFSDIFPKS